MNPSARRIPSDKLRPESQPHGTTEDQIHEMESEGPGVKNDPKPSSPPPPGSTTTVSRTGRRHEK
jgi:hypothetical protein